MIAVARMTAKLERRLKKLEREITRPIPWRAAVPRPSAPAKVENPTVRPGEEWESFKRHIANNDNRGKAGSLASVLPAAAPPVLLHKEVPKSTAPAVMPEKREKTRTLASKPAPEPKPAPERKPEPQPKPQPEKAVPRAALANLLMLGAVASLSSFLVVFYLV